MEGNSVHPLPRCSRRCSNLPPVKMKSWKDKTRSGYSFSSFSLEILVEHSGCHVEWPKGGGEELRYETKAREHAGGWSLGRPDKGSIY